MAADTQQIRPVMIAYSRDCDVILFDNVIAVIGDKILSEKSGKKITNIEISINGMKDDVCLNGVDADYFLEKYNVFLRAQELLKWVRK